MSTWELRFQLQKRSFNLRCSLFLSFDHFDTWLVLLSLLPATKHIHTHTHSRPGRPQRRYLSSKRHIIVVGLSLGNHIVHPTWEFACEHIPFSPFYCIICLFFILFQFRLFASRVFCKIFTLFMARSPPAAIPLAFAFKSTHPHTLPHSLPLALTLSHSLPLPLRHSNSPTECCMPLS